MTDRSRNPTDKRLRAVTAPAGPADLVWLFAGRKGLVDQFASWVSGPPAERPALLHVTGQSGMGKTWLLRMLAWRARERGKRTAMMQAPNMDVVFLDDGHQLGADSVPDPVEQSVAQGAMVVVASRRAMPLSWRNRFGRAAVSTVLQPLTREEAARALAAREVREEDAPAILDFCGGVPGLLALSADLLHQNRGMAFKSAVRIAVAGAFLEELLVGAQDPNQRLALDVAAVARVVTPQLMERVLQDFGQGDHALAGTLCSWLASLPSVDVVARGLQLHEQFRRPLLLVLQEQAPERHVSIRRVLREACRQQALGLDHRRAWLLDLISLERDYRGVDRLVCSLLRDDLHGIRLVPPSPAADATAPTRHACPGQQVMEARCPGDTSSSRLAIQQVYAHPDMGGLEAGCQCESWAMMQARLDATGGLKPAQSALLVTQWTQNPAGTFPGAAAVSLATELVRLLVEDPAIVWLFVELEHPGLWTPVLEAWGMVPVTLGVGTHGGTMVAVDLRWRTRWHRQVAHQVVQETAAAAPAVTPAAALDAVIEERLGLLAVRHQLPQRDVELIRLLLLGRNLSEIAVVLQIKPRTAKYHQARLLERIGADTRADVLRVLMSQGR